MLIGQIHISDGEETGNRKPEVKNHYRKTDLYVLDNIFSLTDPRYVLFINDNLIFIQPANSSCFCEVDSFIKFCRCYTPA